MVNIRWEDHYSVGVEELDEQHKALIRLINRIPSEPLGGEGLRTMAEVLKDLLDYAAQHFATEEECMRGAGYPKLPDHVAQHQVYREQVQEWIQRFRHSYEIDHGELLRFLVEWLIDHIMEADADYAPYLIGPDRPADRFKY